MGRGRASPRDADMLEPVKMGWASLGCSLFDCSFKKHHPDVHLCPSNSRSFLWQQLNPACSFLNTYRISFFVLPQNPLTLPCIP